MFCSDSRYENKIWRKFMEKEIGRIQKLIATGSKLFKQKNFKRRQSFISCSLATNETCFSLLWSQGMGRYGPPGNRAANRKKSG